MSGQKISTKTYKYRLYPTKRQEETFKEWVETCRRLYNDFIEQRHDHYEKIKDLPKEERKYISCFDQIKQLPEMKKENHFLQRPYAHILQNVAKRVDYAFGRFIEERAKGNSKWGKPKFKKRKDYKSFTYTEYANGYRFKIIDNKLKLGKIGLVKVVIDRAIPEKAIIKTCTIKRDVNQWYASIVFQISSEIPNVNIDINKAIGIDVGLTKYGTLSNGDVIENPKWIYSFEKKLAKEQRRLSRMAKRSNNWRKQCLKIAKIHQKIRNQRKDYLQKETTKLVNTYDLISLEDLKIENMMQNHYLAKSIGNVSWGMFRNFLSYKTEESGKVMFLVNPYDTTQLCSGCEEKVKKSLAMRIHSCPNCGLIIDRDENSARIILKRGVKKFQSSIDNTAGLAGSACGETSIEAQGSKKIVN